jgi:hypothetical protein
LKFGNQSLALSRVFCPGDSTTQVTYFAPSLLLSALIPVLLRSHVYQFLFVSFQITLRIPAVSSICSCPPTNVNRTAPGGL